MPCGILGEACQPRPHTKTEHAASHSSRLVPQPLSTHQAASAAVTESISGCMQAAKPLPPGLLLFKVPFITAFHLFLCAFVCLFLLFTLAFLCVMNRTLTPGANTLSSQSGDNDYHLDLCLIKHFPVCSNRSLPFLLPSSCYRKKKSNCLMTSPEKVFSTVW